MCYVPYVAFFFTVFQNENDINGAFLLYYVESRFCTVLAVATPQYFLRTSKYQFLWLV